MATPLEKCMPIMVSTFAKYAGKEGDKHKLSKAELKELLCKELPSFCKEKKDDATFQQLMSLMDCNQDNQVDFQEFVVFMSCLIMMCNDYFDGYSEKLPRNK